MSEKEAFEEITSRIKWYEPLGITPVWAYTLKKRFAEGKLKQSTIDNILTTFGYYKKKEAVWAKK